MILIGMEHSETIRDTFTVKGYEAVSCDFLPSETLGAHYQGAIYNIISARIWDLVIIHPTCTALCVSGNHVYAEGKPKHNERIKAIKLTENLWFRCIKHAKRVCLENPVGVLSTHSAIGKPQYIQPYNFGHDASKKTGLYLHGLPELIPTKKIQPRYIHGKPRWANQTDSGQNRLPPSKDRWKLRSKTYQGIADAMVNQWGKLLHG